ncbi:ABC transporter ATP-binding protein [Anaerocolumna sp. AGMB13020]|uniref:ABC transporter ATP-binding protein n=1 Tax=Anaerocolumna sp. AGMB13020 TaxID=3081750 RepID=UPI002954C80A|nr:ABC transporter ATP-binding protein [Anaerocolumna sp. AGMB13020]WOO38270.1 ABC transporter ATP-binding protein [Anaerocolumna sp. AGMB13020]
MSWRMVVLLAENREAYMIQCDNLVKIYKTRDSEVLALQGLDMTVRSGELLAVVGKSGSGKSTFLNMIGGLDKPSAGKLMVDGKNLFTMTQKELVEYKKRTVGFVWQNNARNLFPYLNALENIQVPMLFTGEKQRKENALELLELVGMSHRKLNKLAELSGGEQQRIAIAIALANAPKLLLADEPTGSVDKQTSDYILDIFRELNRSKKTTVLIVTHDNALARKVNRVISIQDGKISSELHARYDLEALKELAWEEGHEEYTILDRAGRLQLPSEMLEKMGVQDNKVILEFDQDRIIIKAVST